MEQSEGRNDVHVFTGPGVPRIFEDAYAVNAEGTLKVWRWSTRKTPKHHPVAEFAPGCWEHYEHRGEQGDEVVEQKQPEPPRPAPRRARPAPRYQDEGDETATDTVQTPWAPDPVAEREAQIRSREPGAPENLQPATVRPSLPPKDFSTPTHRLPQRTPAVVNDATEVLPAIRAEQSQQQSADRPPMRRRTRGSWPRGGGAWLALVVTALSILAAVH